MVVAALIALCTIDYIVVAHILRQCECSCARSAPFILARDGNGGTKSIPGLSQRFEGSNFSMAFVFSTGRSGTKYMSQLFVSHSPPKSVAYVTHQEEHDKLKTKDFVARYYRRLAQCSSEQMFNESAHIFVKETKLPFVRNLLTKHKASRLVYTGHLPLAFGLGPSLIRNMPVGTIRILRLRRDRVTSALSLMSLGPENEDPWSDGSRSKNLRWFPRPSSAFTRLRVNETVFQSMNRFQRWLWYVDDVECRWQSLLQDTSLQFEWVETSLESLETMDNGRGWSAVAAFLGVKVDFSVVGRRENSIQDKNREKPDVSESLLRAWDAQYRRMVGPCDLSGIGSRTYSWKDS